MEGQDWLGKGEERHAGSKMESQPRVLGTRARATMVKGTDPQEGKKDFRCQLPFLFPGLSPRRPVCQGRWGMRSTLGSLPDTLSLFLSLSLSLLLSVSKLFSLCVLTALPLMAFFTLPPTYISHPARLSHLPQQSLKAESQPLEGSATQLPILADMLLYYCRFAARPVLLQVYQTEVRHAALCLPGSLVSCGHHSQVPACVLLGLQPSTSPLEAPVLVQGVHVDVRVPPCLFQLTFVTGEKATEIFIQSLELGHSATTRAIKASGGCCGTLLPSRDG